MLFWGQAIREWIARFFFSHYLLRSPISTTENCRIACRKTQQAHDASFRWNTKPLLELCQSVPVDRCKDLKTSSQEEQEQRLAICKRIERLGGELPMNCLDCEVIYLERFAQKLQRMLDRKIIGLCAPQQMHTKRAYARVRLATLLAVKSILLTA